MEFYPTERIKEEKQEALGQSLDFSFLAQYLHHPSLAGAVKIEQEVDQRQSPARMACMIDFTREATFVNSVCSKK